MPTQADQARNTLLMFYLMDVLRLRSAAGACCLLLALLSCQACTPIRSSARAPNDAAQECPPGIRAFRESLQSDGGPPESMLLLPVTVFEAAYEVGPGWCAPHYRRVAVASTKELGPFLKQLERTWKGASPTALGRTRGYWGVTAAADCEHVWAIKLDASGRKVASFVVDASNERGGNTWSPDRIDFNLMDFATD
jgi:hypothetical protein